MFRNIQSDRRNSMLDEQYGLVKKNILNSPDVSASRSTNRKLSKVGSIMPSLNKITRSPGSKLSIASRNEQRKSTINSNMSSNKKRNKLLQEYQDIFQDEQSLSSNSNSSSENQSKISKPLKLLADPKNFDKEIDIEQEFIHKALNQRLSTISKQKGVSTIKGSQKSQLQQTVKSFKSMKQMSVFSKANTSQSNIKQSMKFRKENSISSSKNFSISDQQEIHSLVKILENVGIPESEQNQYKQIIEELEKQCVEINPNSRPRIKSKVRKTFVSLFHQYYGMDNSKKHDGDQNSQYSICQNESIAFGVNRTHEANIQQKIQSNINVTSIMENVFTKKNNSGHASEKMKKLLENFQQEFDQDDDEDDSFKQSKESSDTCKNEDDEDEELYSRHSNTYKDPTGNQQKYIIKYQKKYKRDPIYDPYPLLWLSQMDYKWALNDYNQYWDLYPLLNIRKIIVLIVRLINIAIFKIITHKLFTIFVLGSIIFNIYVFVQTQNDNLTEEIQLSLKEQKKSKKNVYFILYLFIGENLLKIIGLGIVAFFSDLQNLFDILILILFLIHQNYPQSLIVDFSTARLFRLLIVMSIFSKRLKIMLIALKHSIKFLVESLIIVIIFSYFFALFGMHLFQGLFQYRCYLFEEGIQTNEECGFNLSCVEHEAKCLKSITNPNATTFDDIVYSYMNVVRLMIFNEWTEPIYLAMHTFHDFTVIYFILLIFIISIFGANLIIAVLKIYYSQTLEKYEFEEIDEIMEEKVVLNLRIIKNYQIDFDMYNNAYKFTRTSPKDLIEQVTIARTQIGNYQKQLNYKHKYLSARQTKEQEEIKNRKRGIKTKLSKFDNLNEIFTIDKLFLSEQNKDQFMQKLYLNEQFDKDYFKFFYLQTLKENQLYSWRTVVNKNYEFVSTSEVDIFCDQTKNKQLKGKRERELEFIRRFSMKQYYIIKKSEYSFLKPFHQMETQKLSLSSDQKLVSEKKKFPIKQKKKVVLKKNQTQLVQQENLQIPEKQVDSQLEIIKNNSNKFKIKQINHQNPKTLKINDVDCDYDELQNYINRQIPEFQEEFPNYEELYVKYRLDECKQQLIYKHNWSGGDILTQKNLIFEKKSIFYQLNDKNAKIWLVGIKGIIILIQKYSISILKNKYAKIFFDILVLCNILLLSLIGLLDENIIRKINDYLVFILVGELILKLLQQGILRFCSIPNNLFDTVILVCAVIQSIYVLQNPDKENVILDVLNSFQTFLVYRIIKYHHFAVKIAKVTKKSFPSFFNLILLMITLMLIFSFIGMNLYKNKFPVNTDFGLQQSFDDIQAAFLTVFVRAANEDWFGMVILGVEYSYKVPTMFYSVISVYVLNLMTIGFILAIILDAFSSFANGENDLEENQYKIDTQISDEIIQEIDGPTLGTENCQSTKENDEVVIIEPQNNLATVQSTKLINQFSNYIKQIQNNIKFFDLVQRINNLVNFMFKDFQFFTNYESKYALFMFSQENVFRKFCYRFIHYKLYNNLIQFTFFVTIINMCCYTYYDHENNVDKEIYLKLHNKIEFVVNCILILDSILKIISFGFFQDKGAFSNEFWRVIDFIYQITFFIDQISSSSVFLYFNILKYTRPFRFLYLFESLKYINGAISKSFADLINILFVQLMVWLIFAIFGIIIYRGKMGYCEDPLNFEVNQEQCEMEGKEWINNLYNFDDIGNAMLTLYRITACDDWVYICQVCLNSRGADQGPILYGNRWFTFIYFILFILIGVLFFLGFFAGILFINFQTHKEKLMKQILTKDQQLFADITKLILKEVPNYSDPPKSMIRKLASNIVKSKLYESWILVTILANTIILTFFYDEASIDLQKNLEYQYQILTFFLILDTLLKIFAFGIVRYWGFLWRKIEFILSLIAFMDLLLYLIFDWSKYYYNSTIDDKYFIIYRLAFALRNLRTLLIIQQFKGLTRLLRILNYSASFLFQILCFFISIMLFYGFIGCQYFGNIESGAYLNDYMNFTNIGKALLILFKICTKNNWIRIMIDVSERNPLCNNENIEYCGVSWLFANIYFYTYLLISSFVAFNLFVTALVDQFEKFFNSQNSVLQTYIENIDPFRTTWCKYSTETKGLKMHSKYLANFLLELGPPLGANIGDNIWDAAKSASNFKIRADQEGYIHFQEVLYETIRFIYRDTIFRTGTPESIDAIKQIDKDTRFRLHFKRINILDRREPIYEKMYIKGNFNILREYLFLLMIFRTLKSYSVKTISKIKQNLLSPDSMKKFHFPSNSEETEKEESIIYYPKDIKQRKVTDESEDQEIVHLNVHKYLINKGNKKLKFLDESQETQDQGFLFLPDTGKNENKQQQVLRVKSALKKQPQQAFNFVDFEQLEQKNLQNPMLDSSHLNDNSKAQLTDSLIDSEQQINNFHVSVQQQPHSCRFSISSQDENVGTESHHFFNKGKPKKQGRNFLI